MRVLAIDTALANCAAAVLDNGPETACFVASGAEIGRGHAEQLMTMIGEVMAETSTAFTDLDRIVVTVGPGSFTGLRVGLSVARGFGLVLGKPVVGVTTLAAMARSRADAACNRPLLVALHGKAEEVYCQQFNSHGGVASDAAVQTLAELAGSLPLEIDLLGSAAADVARSLGSGTCRILSEQGYPDIREVAELGILTDPAVAAPSPLYLRPPDATPQTRGRIERQ